MANSVSPREKEDGHCTDFMELNVFIQRNVTSDGMSKETSEESAVTSLESGVGGPQVVEFAEEKTGDRKEKQGTIEIQTSPTSLSPWRIFGEGT
jgi:hypothetical protein